MNIDVKRIGDYLSVEVEIADATIDLGFLEEDEANELADKLLDVVWDLTGKPVYFEEDL